MPNIWGARFRLLKGLQVFELELETLQGKRADLDEIIEQDFAWKFPLQDDKVLVCDCDAAVYSSWTGSRHFKREGRRISASSSSASASRPLTSRKNSIATITKNKIKRMGSESSKYPGLSREEEEEEELAPEVRLEYYVVTLTFRAQDHEGEKREVDNAEGEETGDELNAVGARSVPAATAVATPTPAPVVPPIARQGLFTPAPWVPRRSGFPTAYG